ncbi:AAA family ATPase [Vibrio albus]|uniref:AAA family ATPase n=2 Tax=Vibrio albus TaxID=2200953 RepID=A0A2U3BF04_9VIBR|nr:AAA family ATPase [Vibrio albus]
MKPCLLFSIRNNGETVKGTTIGGFGEVRFELSGSRLNFKKLNLDNISKEKFIEGLNNLKIFQDINFEKDKNNNVSFIRFPFDSKDASAIIKGWLDLINSNDICEEIIQSDLERKESKKIEVNMSRNAILYGPPGTGKTYHTIEAAVRATEPEFVWQTREELKAEYDHLVTEKRIRFVTFHQSYGYEEFVEGLSAEVAEDKSVIYKIKKGVFKSICEDASVSELDTNQKINSNGRVWKLSIEGAHQNATKKYCLEHNMGAIGWGDTGDLNLEERNEYFSELGSNDQNSLNNFTNEMTIGDLVLCIDSKRTVEAIGVVSGEYIYDEAGLPTRDDYCHHLPINWLVTGVSIDFMALNDNKQFSLQTCYPLFRMNVADVLNYLQTKDIVLLDKENSRGTKQNYVLIIDEINRGNISKIFGELITLIEPSKREGQTESLQLTLPYSGKPFSVPDNLYIIGTMNTADRSLTMMDTALRRRFEFKEMMPEPKLLAGSIVEHNDKDNDTYTKIDLFALLTKLNERIEVLFDREHTLGHAFFMPVKELVDADEQEAAFEELVHVFQNKIIPLLQEYFFDDWEKIRLVLADNQKPDALQLITKTEYKDLTELFGKQNNVDLYGEGIVQYRLRSLENEDDKRVWQDPQVYLGMYQTLITETEQLEQGSM